LVPRSRLSRLTSVRFRAHVYVADRIVSYRKKEAQLMVAEGPHDAIVSACVVVKNA